MPITTADFPGPLEPESQTQAAELVAFDGTTLLTTVRVPAFPTNPDVVEWDGRYFTGGTIGYGVDYLTYTEATFFKVPK